MPLSLLGSNKKMSASFIKVLSFGALRLIPAIGILLFTLVAVSFLSENEAGELILYTAVLYLLGFIARGGVDLYVLKEISISFESNKAEAKRLLVKSTIEVFFIAFLLSFLYAGYLWFYSETPDKYWYFLLPVFSLVGLNSMILRGFKKEYRGVVLDVGTGSLAAVIMLVLYAYFIRTPSLYLFYLSYAVAMCSIFVIQSMMLLMIATQNLGHYDSSKPWGVPIFFASWRYSVVNICSYLILWLPVFLVSKISSVAVVIMGLAVRLSSVPGFFVSTVDALVAPTMARMYASDEKGTIKSYLSKLRVYLVALAAFLLIFSYPILYVVEVYFYSNTFEGAGGVAFLGYILVVSHAISLYLGPVGYVLLMTGYESVQKNLKFIMLVVTGFFGWAIVLFVEDDYWVCISMAVLIAMVRTIPNLIMAKKVARILE